MSKAFVLSLLLLAVALAAGDAAPATPNPAAAKAASDALQTRDEAVKAADAKAVATLKKLMAKYKKDAATLTMLAVKLHKLDPNDADAIAALKDVPADQQDLLGEVAQPGKYLTDVQAKVISDALVKGKFTAKEWEALPGKAYEVEGQLQVSVFNARANSSFLVVPNPADRWNKDKDWNGGKRVDWTGQGDWRMLLCLRVDPGKDDSVVTYELVPSPLVKVGKAGALTLGSKETKEKANNAGVGSIRVKVYEIAPVGE